MSPIPTIATVSQTFIEFPILLIGRELYQIEFWLARRRRYHFSLSRLKLEKSNLQCAVEAESMFGKIGISQLSNMCHRVGTGLKAGVDICRIWEQEAKRSLGQSSQQMHKVLDHVSRGYSLTEAMRSCGGYFPPLLYEMVEVGETAGKLEAIFFELEAHYRIRVELRRQFISEVRWPIIQLIAAVLLIALLIVVMGWLSAMFGIELALFGLSGTIGAFKFLFFVAFVFGGIALSIFAVVRGWAGPLPLMFTMRIPYLGSCMRDFAMSRMASVLSIALDAGVDARRSIRLALRASQNPFFMAQTRRVDEAILAGHEFNVALRQTGAFPREFVEDLATAEVSGTHSESMQHVAKLYHDRALSASKIITTIASFLTWALIACVIVFAIISIYSSMISGVYKELLGP